MVKVSQKNGLQDTNINTKSQIGQPHITERKNQDCNEIENSVSNKNHEMMTKVSQKKGIIENSTELNNNTAVAIINDLVEAKSETNITKRKYQDNNESLKALKEKSASNMGIFSSEGFLGFNTSTQHKSKDDIHDVTFPNITTNIEYHSTPNTTKQPSGTPKIKILSNISLTNNKTNLNTSLIALPFNKTNNLHTEYHNDPSILHNPDFHYKTVENDDNDDNVDYEDWVEDSEESEDEYFGFKEINECSMDNYPMNAHRKISIKKKITPWRLEIFFKRNPHILRIKKNGLPCLQQEMVMDYEFAKRIEALSANNVNKHPEPPPPKPPVQTTMLNYIQTHNNQENPGEHNAHSSLFDYEEFDVAKSSRRVLGVLHDNQQTISTPKRIVQTTVASPNISIIPREDVENMNPFNINRRYGRKLVSDKNRAGKEVNEEEEDDILPSILQKDGEEISYTDVPLFQDIDEDKKCDFSIKLPSIKYENKRQRKRCLSEGRSDDEDDGKRKRRKKICGQRLRKPNMRLGRPKQTLDLQRKTNTY